MAESRAPRSRTPWLYGTVIAVVGLGIAVGLLFSDLAVELKPLDDATGSSR